MKDLAIAILGKPKKGEDEELEESEGEEMGDLPLAMKTLSAALKSGDHDGAAEAFKSAVEFCKYDDAE